MLPCDFSKWQVVYSYSHHWSQNPLVVSYDDLIRHYKNVVDGSVSTVVGTRRQPSCSLMHKAWRTQISQDRRVMVQVKRYLSSN